MKPIIYKRNHYWRVDLCHIDALLSSADDSVPWSRIFQAREWCRIANIKIGRGW